MFQDNNDSKSKISRGGEAAEHNPLQLFDEFIKLLDYSNYGSKLAATVAEYERMASATRTLFGGTEMLSTSLKNTFAAARSSVLDLGGNMKDIEDIQIGIFEKLNTQTMLNTEEFGKLYSVAKLVSKTGTNLGVEAAEIASKFVNAGIQLNNVGDIMNDVLNKAREIGVSTVATYSILSQNLEVANTFSFKNGIQGMAEMAANAALMRVDMGKTLATAESFLDPEKAIEAATQFQNLGITIAELLDPRKLEYMSLFEPEKLGEKISEAMKQYVVIDELGNKTISAFGLQVMRKFQKYVSFTKEELVNMGKTTFDIGKKMEEMRFNPNLFGDEETKKLIAGMATMATKGEFKGQYVVTFDDKSGKEVTKTTATLSQSDIETLKKATEEKKSVELLKQANGDTKNMVNYLRSIDGTLINYLATQKDVQKFMLEGTKITRDLTEKLGKFAGFTRTESGQLSTNEIKKGLDNLINELKTKGKEIDYKTIGDTLTKNVKELKDVFSPIINKIKKEYNQYSNVTNNSLFESTPTETPTQQQTGNQTPQSTTTPTIPPQPISSPTNVTYSPTDINKKTSIEEKSESLSRVEFGGTVTINVTPTEFKQSVLEALNSPDVQSKIASVINLKNTQDNNFTGSGNVSKLPKTNFV